MMEHNGVSRRKLDLEKKCVDSFYDSCDNAQWISGFLYNNKVAHALYYSLFIRTAMMADWKNVFQKLLCGKLPSVVFTVKRN